MPSSSLPHEGSPPERCPALEPNGRGKDAPQCERRAGHREAHCANGTLWMDAADQRTVPEAAARAAIRKLTERVLEAERERDEAREALEWIRDSWTTPGHHRQDVRYQQCVSLARDALRAAGSEEENRG